MTAQEREQELLQQAMALYFAGYVPPEHIDIASWRLAYTAKLRFYTLHIMIHVREVFSESTKAIALAKLKQDISYMAFQTYLIRGVIVNHRIEEEEAA